MMLNQRIQGIPQCEEKTHIWYLMGEVCQGMKGLGMLDTLEPKVGWKKGKRNQFKKTRFFYSFDVGGLSWFDHISPAFL